MRTDPLSNLPGLRVGVRLSLRVAEADGPADRIGLVLALDETGLVLEDRSGRRHAISRDSVRLARLVPTVARGRNPRHAPPELIAALAHDPALVGELPTGGGEPGERGEWLRDAAARLLSHRRQEATGDAAMVGTDCWIARLCDLVDHLDDGGVTPLPGRDDTRETAARGEARGLVNGEWAAFRLADAEALEPLAAWAARRNARNVVLTSPLPDDVLLGLGLEPLRG